MIYRYLGIALIKFAVIFIVIGILFGFLPASIGALGSSAIAWVFVFLLAYVFASVAYVNKAPTTKQMLTLAGVWFGVTILGFFSYGYFVSIYGVLAMFSIQVIVQIIVEIAAVLLAGILMRRRTLKQMLGE